MDIVIREIRENDLFNGFLESLDSLRQASNLREEQAKNTLQEITSNPNHRIYVAEDNGQVIGSATLLVEPKFIHNSGRVGHIEDVVINRNFQGKGIGEKLILVLLNSAKEKGCYKTVLSCTDDLRPFYERIGFKKTQNEMRFDH